MEISVTHNLKEFAAGLDRIRRQQIPFAAMLALNDTAKDVQKAAVSRAEAAFENRRKWYAPGAPSGIKVERATKGSLKASVYTKVRWAELQEKGGTKTPQRGKNLAVPSDATPVSLRRAGGVRKLLDTRKRAFLLPKGAFVRRSRSSIERMFAFSPDAHVRPRFGFFEAALREARKAFAGHMRRRLAQALRTAR
ncbi:MAG: hypothetical protein ABW189_03765 [Rickettsiales bacterium]